MKKQPQQPEQQRSDYSASALSSLPDRASGDRGLVTASLVRLLMIRRFDAQADHIDENAAALRKWADTEHEARCRELCASYLREMANTLRVEQKIADLDEAVRAADSAVGHDASSEPRQNETNAVDAVAVREALAELDKLEAVTKAWNTYDADSIQVAVAARNALPAISAARALLEPK